MSDARVRELVRTLLLDMTPAEVLEHVALELGLGKLLTVKALASATREGEATMRTWLDALADLRGGAMQVLPVDPLPLSQLWETLKRWREWKAENPPAISSGHLLVSLRLMRFLDEAEALCQTLARMDEARAAPPLTAIPIERALASLNLTPEQVTTALLGGCPHGSESGCVKCGPRALDPAAERGRVR